MSVSAVALANLATGVEWLAQSSGAVNVGQGRQVYVYVRGTTDEVQVYSDSGLSEDMSQPLTTGTVSQGTPGGVPGYVASGQSIDFVDVLSGQRAQAESLAVLDLVGPDPVTGQPVVAGTGTAIGLPSPVQNVTNAFSQGALGGVLRVVAESGATQTLDVASAQVFDVTLTASCAFTFESAETGTPATITMILRQGAGGFSASFPAVQVPNLSQNAGNVSLLSFTSTDGGVTWLLGEYRDNVYGQPQYPLSVDWNLVVDASGERHTFAGCADYMVPYYSDSGETPDATLELTAANNFAARNEIFAKMASLGIGTVRIPLSADVYINEVYATQAEQIANWQAIVASANAQGLSVIAGWWDQPGAVTAPSSNQMTAWHDFYEAVAGNPMVMFEPYNEPVGGITPAQWQSLMIATITYWRQTLGYTGILFIDTTSYSWAFGSILSYVQAVIEAAETILPTGNGSGNVCFANHRYADANTDWINSGDQAAWQAEVGQYTNAYPIMMTEVGYYNNAGSVQPTWNAEAFQTFATTAQAAGLNGMCAFVWDWVDSNSMDTAGGSSSSITALTTLNADGLIYVNSYLAWVRPRNPLSGLPGVRNQNWTLQYGAWWNTIAAVFQALTTVEAVQTNTTSNGGGTSNTIEFTDDVTEGNSILVGIFANTASADDEASVTDTLGNTYQLVEQIENAAAPSSVFALFQCVASNATGANTVTVTTTQAAPGGGFCGWAAEVHGIGAPRSSPVTSSGSTVAPMPGLLTAKPGDFVVALTTAGAPISDSPVTPWTSATAEFYSEVEFGASYTVQPGV